MTADPEEPRHSTAPPLVSILTATYNRSNVLQLVIETVRRQTVPDWEWVIVGDHCTDDTADVVASFGDPRIRFLNLAQGYGEQSGPNNEDRLFVTRGQVKIVLFDGRHDSPTRGRVNELRFGTVRPALVVVPPGVWHGVQNISSGPSSVLNIVDRAYQYEDPDHWRLPPDTPEIPYSFRTGRLVDGLR